MKKFKNFIFLVLIGVFSTFAQQKKYITYKVAEGETIEIIAKKLSITPYDLLKLNPDIKNNVSVNDIIVIPNKVYSTLNEIENIDLSHIAPSDIIVDNYIYHEVQKKETLYSILKKYKTEISILNKINPFLLQGGLQYGRVLKIPVQADFIEAAEKEKYTQPYIVKAKETKYGISKDFGISIAYLEELNPKIKEEGLQIDDIIIVPKKIVKKEQSNYTIHKVKKMETFFSLSNMYGVSKEELILANPELKDGVKEGMLLKIPDVIDENTAIFADRILDGKKLNIAMMLPFRKKTDSLDFANDRLLKITTDFYLGSLIAIDSLKDQGLSIHMKVYDTENSAYISNLLSKKNEFNEYDVVIGPLFLKNVIAVSKNLYLKDPLIISPISTQDHSKIYNKNLVQDNVTKESLANKMIEFLKSKYVNQKLIIIADEEKNLDISYQSILKDLQVLDTLDVISIIRPQKGYIKPDIFKENLVEGNEIWVLLIGDNEAFIADVINNLGVLPVEINVSLFAFNKGKSFNKIDNNFLARVNFHYPTSLFLDENSSLLNQFNNKYKDKYHIYPSKYAVEGFDSTYDILMRLVANRDLIGQGTSQRLAKKFNYVENTSGSILNQGIFIIKYDGLELKVAE